MPSRQLGRYGAVGFEFAATIGAGFFVGRTIDHHFESHGIATWIGFVFGVLGGFLLLMRAARQLEAEAASDDAAIQEEAQEDRLHQKLETVEKSIRDEENSDR